MKFYDLHVHVPKVEKIEEIIQIAEKMGYSGIGLTLDSSKKKKFKKLKNKIKKIDSKLDLITSLEINPEGVGDMKRKISKARKKAEIVIVSGGEYKINRTSVEDDRVDILSHPEYKRKDSGIDHIIAKSAKEKNVAIEINFHEVLETYRKIRSHVLDHLSKNVKICKKYKAPIVITSDAKDKWSMRDPRELAALGQLLGMELKESMNSVSSVPKSIIEANRRKLKNK